MARPRPHLSRETNLLVCGSKCSGSYPAALLPGMLALLVEVRGPVRLYLVGAVRLIITKHMLPTAPCPALAAPRLQLGSICVLSYLSNLLNTIFFWYAAFS